MSATRRGAQPEPVRRRRRRSPRPDDGGLASVSSTAVAAEALRTGIVPRSCARRCSSIPREDDLRVGDPDEDPLANEYVGEELPGGSAPTPDQNAVDAIGRAYGLQEEDNGSLRTSWDVLTRRDRHRSELRPPRKPQV